MVKVHQFSFVPECDEYIRIFEYSNILVTNIYSDIRSYQFFFYEYIRTFVRVKFVLRIYSDIHLCKFVDTNIFRYSFVSKFLQMSHSGTNTSQPENILLQPFSLLHDLFVCLLQLFHLFVCLLQLIQLSYFIFLHVF